MGGEGKGPGEGMHLNGGAKEEWGSIAEAIASIVEPSPEVEKARREAEEDLQHAKIALDAALKGSNEEALFIAFRANKVSAWRYDEFQRQHPFLLSDLMKVLEFVVKHLSREKQDQDTVSGHAEPRLPKIRLQCFYSGSDIRCHVCVNEQEYDEYGDSLFCTFVFCGSGSVAVHIASHQDVQKKRLPKSASWRMGVIHIVRFLTWVHERYEGILADRLKKTSALRDRLRRELIAATRAVGRRKKSSKK